MAITTTTFGHWLAGLGETGLAAVLDRRRDVLLPPAPRDLGELAQRLIHPQSLVAALRSCALPCIELAEAAQALGSGCSRAALTAFLGDERDDVGAHRDDVERVIEELISRGVIWPGDEGRIELPAAFAEIFPDPLGLGEPLPKLLQDRTADSLRRILAGLGLPKQKTRSDAAAALVAYLTDADRVRAVLATAPAQVAAELAELAAKPHPGSVPSWDDLDDLDYEPDDVWSFDPRRFQQRQQTMQWAEERGLAIRTQYGYDWQLPSEIALALRGPGYRAPFHPRRPLPPGQPVDRDRVESDSAAAATQFAGRALALLDHLARDPVASLKTGGVGARELARLAKATGAEDAEVRLALELAHVRGLLHRVGASVAVSPGFAAWRDAEPAQRFAELLTAWWDYGGTPTSSRDADGKSVRALIGMPYCEGCRSAREGMLDVLAGLARATDRSAVAPAVSWQRPFAHLTDPGGGEPLALGWREAELLGVIAQGALTDLGRLLLRAEVDALRVHAGALLPPSADHATFGTDLTVFVAGAPSARVSAVLDAAADRESRGGAVTWRFGPASVRRALDDGMSGDELTAALAGIARSELPQPLRYLIADVARRHGNLRLTSVTSCVRSDDAALIAELAANRKLARLGLRLLAPTVLTSSAEVPELLSALRAGGYFPMSDDRLAEVVTLTPRPKPGGRGPSWTPPKVRRDPPADPALVAARLLRPSQAPVQLTLMEQRVATLAMSLSAAEVRQLAHAIDTQSRVAIVYESGTGSITDRIIDRPELSGGTLYAWCELRQDDRVFTVAGIRSVTAV